MSSLMTPSQLATRLKLPRTWLHAEAVSGRLPCLKVGRRLLFNLHAVEEALSKLAAQGRGVANAG